MGDTTGRFTDWWYFYTRFTVATVATERRWRYWELGLRS